MDKTYVRAYELMPCAHPSCENIVHRNSMIDQICAHCYEEFCPHCWTCYGLLYPTKYGWDYWCENCVPFYSI